MTPELKDGQTVYACAFGHSHGTATFAVLCESAPKLDVYATHHMQESGRLVCGYACKRCGAEAPSRFDDLMTIDNKEAGVAEAGTQVARIVVGDGDDPDPAWREEARAFHEAHTGCSAEAK